jgi:hypothetical protein
VTTLRSALRAAVCALRAVFGVLALRRARVPEAFFAAVLRRVDAALLRAFRWVLEVVVSAMG